MTVAKMRARFAPPCLCLLAFAGGQAHAQPAAGVLRDGETRSADQHAGDRFSYELELGEPGTYVLSVKQRGLDVVVSVTPPGGPTTRYDSPAFRDGRETVVLEAGAGRYRVEIRSEEYTGAAGGHTIALARLGPASDAREREALRLESAAGAANSSGGEEGWLTAASGYTRAAEIWLALGRTREQADALYAAATIRYWQLFDWAASVEGAAAAAARYAELGEAALAANARHLQGAARVEQALEATQSSTDAAVSPESDALFAEALQLLESAREVHERLGNVYDLGLVLNNFGYTYYSKGDFDRARGYYTQAATLLHNSAEWSAEAKPLQNIAVLDLEAAHLLSAIATFDRILEILPPNLVADRANVLDNLGATHRLLGNLDEALQSFAAALELQSEIDDEQGRGRSLRRIGETYYTLGDPDLAKQYLELALPIAVRTQDGRGQEGALRNLGNVAYLEHDYDAALERHRQALAIAASVSDRAHLQLLIAKDLVALGRAGEAANVAAEAATVADEAGSDVLRAGALSAAGRARVLAGDAAAAEASLQHAAAIYDRLDLRAERVEALHGLALAARAANRTERALEYGAAALRELESWRERVADPELRAYFAAARRDYYDAQIDLLMSQEPAQSRAALTVSEGGRARMIADLLREAAVDLRRDVDPALRAQETALYQRLAERRYERDLLIEQKAQSGDARLESVLSDLSTLENSLNLLEIDIRRGNPRLTSAAAFPTLTPEQIQSSLDADTVLLQYSLGAEASYVWAVTRDGMTSAWLPARAAVEDAARRTLEGLHSRAATAAARGALEQSLAQLAALVVEPVASRLAGRARVVLALDGALQYVPFGLLPLRGPDGALAPLLQSHEVVEVPSLSALAAARSEPRSTPRRTLAVFADPVLQASDPRLGAIHAKPAMAAAAAPTRFAAPAVGGELGRLLSTAYEAETIAGLVRDDQRLLAEGLSASRAAVMGAPLGDFRYIHFATHGIVDARYPGLSALVLSRFDDRGNAEDGFLRLNDIYDLKLNADLVVLSACETALGREVRGEGLIGLTQGFMAAGARGVVASLWQMPDRATAELMTQFYGYLIRDGARPAEALRKAQLWAAAQPRYRDPLFWGGFVLVGDWR
jgi:CHAT domain-containing protein/tetratricopeptide (TPR) repeat protein